MEGPQWGRGGFRGGMPASVVYMYQVKPPSRSTYTNEYIIYQYNVLLVVMIKDQHIFIKFKDR